MTSSPSRVAAALCLGAALASGPSAAGQKTDERVRAESSEVTVTLKLVQVYVTGKDHKPVTDLAAADFELTDNGRPVTVSHFERHALGGGDAVPAAPPDPAAGAAEPVRPLSRKFFLFFDVAFSEPRGAVRSRAAALEFLDKLAKPGDEIGVLSFSGSRGFTIHEYLTTDHARVRAVVDAFGLRSAMGRAESLNQLIYADELRALSESETVPKFYTEQARAQAAGTVDPTRKMVYTDQARRFLQSLADVARALRTIPGHKNIILFSGGIARQLLFGRKRVADAPEWSAGDAEGALAAMSAYDGVQADSGITSFYSEMLREFKTANAPVYAIDVSRSATEADMDSMTGSSTTTRETSGMDSLRTIAGQTGGKYYSNTTDLSAALSDVESVTSAYYVLGYSIPEVRDGKFHKVKVKVRRKGCDVAAQNGYNSPRPFAERDPFEKLVQITDMALSDTPQMEVPAEVPVEARTLQAGGWTQLAAFARLDPARDAEAIGETGEAYLLLFDAQGRTTAKSFRVRRPTPAPAGDAVPLFVLPVQPGDYTCRIVLRNLETGKGARGTVPLKVAPGAAPARGLEAPLFLRPGPSWDASGSVEVALSKIFGYDPAAFSPAIDGYTTGHEAIHAALRFVGGGAEFEVEARLTVAGEARAVPVAVVSRAGSGPDRTMVVELKTGALPAGTHTLELVAKPSSGAAGAYVSVPVAVRER